MKQFEPGDVVQLKSGGPKMTVSHEERFEHPAPGQPDVLYICQWFDKGQHQFNRFRGDILVKIDEDQPLL